MEPETRDNEERQEPEIRTLATAERLFRIAIDAVRLHAQSHGEEDRLFCAVLLRRANERWDVVSNSLGTTVGATFDGRLTQWLNSNREVLERFLESKGTDLGKAYSRLPMPEKEGRRQPKKNEVFQALSVELDDESCDHDFVIVFETTKCSEDLAAIYRNVLRDAIQLAKTYVVEHVSKIDALSALSSKLSGEEDASKVLNDVAKILAGAFEAENCTIFLKESKDSPDINRAALGVYESLCDEVLVLRGGYTPNQETIDEQIGKLTYPIVDFDEARAKLRFHDRKAMFPHQRPGLTVQAFRSETGWTFINSREEIENHPWHSQRSRGIYDHSRSGRCNNLLAMVLEIGGQRSGLIKVENKGYRSEKTVPFDRLDILRLEHLASVLAIAIEWSTRKAQAKRVEKEIVRDDLTDLYNLTFIKKFEQEHLDRDIGVVFFDIDHFKSYNDRLAWTGADRLLEIVAKTMKDAAEYLQAKDFRGFTILPCRQHGDEFVLIALEGAIELPGGVSSLPEPTEQTESEEAPQQDAPADLAKLTRDLVGRVRSSLRRRIEIDSPLASMSQKIPVDGITVSAGIYYPTPEDCGDDDDTDLAANVESLPFWRAAMASRVAKAAGRDKAVFWADIATLAGNKNIRILDVWDHKIQLDVGFEHGVERGIVFEVLHPELPYDRSFRRVKAQVQAVDVYARTVVCKVTESESEILEKDPVRLRA